MGSKWKSSAATAVDRPDDNLYYGSASSSGNFGTIPPYGKYGVIEDTYCFRKVLD